MSRQRVTKVSSGDIQLPVTLEDVKSHLRVTTDDEDELLRSYLVAAFEWAEERTRRAIVSRNYLIARDDFPYSDWCLPLGHISAIVSVEYLDSSNVLNTWTASPLPYESDLATDYEPRLRPKTGQSWPATGIYFNTARVTVTAGWAQDDIPGTLKQAILMKVAELDEVRGPGDERATVAAGADARTADAMIGAWVLPIWR
jgi:uncharacterized phiE125 gp8 family phage protein